MANGRATMLCYTYISCLCIDKIQQYEGIYLLQVYSTYFGRPSRPSTGVQKTLTVASGTGLLTVERPSSNVA